MKDVAYIRRNGGYFTVYYRPLLWDDDKLAYRFGNYWNSTNFLSYKSARYKLKSMLETYKFLKIESYDDQK